MLTVKILIRRRLSSIYILRSGSYELSLLTLIKLRQCTLFVLSRWKEGISCVDPDQTVTEYDIYS